MRQRCGARGERLLAYSLHLGNVVLQQPEDAIVQRVLGHSATRTRALHSHPHRASELVPALERDVPAIFLHNGSNLP
jgi:hypothetical protein